MTDDIVRRHDFAIGLGRRAGDLGMTLRRAWRHIERAMRQPGDRDAEHDERVDARRAMFPRHRPGRPE